MAIITAGPVLDHLLARLRLNYVDDALYTDDDVLDLFNDAYREACERSQCLRTLQPLTIVSGTREYALPADFHEVIAVVVAAAQLQPIPLETAFLSATNIDGIVPSTAYYINGANLGLWPPPVTTGATGYLLYAATPTPLLSFADDLDARFSIEYADLLVHFVLWRTQMMSGGAERIPLAQFHKGMFSSRIDELRRSTQSMDSTAPSQLPHVSNFAGAAVQSAL